MNMEKNSTYARTDAEEAQETMEMIFEVSHHGLLQRNEPCLMVLVVHGFFSNTHIKVVLMSMVGLLGIIGKHR